jgi:hypothetical protein
MIWIRAEICDEFRTTCPAELLLGQVVPPIYPENLVHLKQSKNPVIQSSLNKLVAWKYVFIAVSKGK